MLDPFEEVSPLEPLDTLGVLTQTLKRSIMWDIIGPYRMRDNPTDFHQQPASPDVMEAEYRDLILRQNSLMYLNPNLSMMCYIAAESATEALLKLDPRYKEMPEEEILQFRAHNVNMGAAIVGSVLGQMLQSGLLHIGGTPCHSGQIS
jgi:hypothetical protein